VAARRVEGEPLGRPPKGVVSRGQRLLGRGCLIVGLPAEVAGEVAGSEGTGGR